MTQASKGLRAGLLISLAVGLSAWGCKSDKPGSNDMARVNGHVIPRAEVEKSVNRQTAGAPQKPASEQLDGLRLEILRQMIDREIYLQSAEKLGVTPTNEEVETQVTQAKAPYTKEAFAKKLQETALTEDEFKQEVRRNLTVEKLLKREIESKVSITDADLQTFYNANKAQFNIAEPRYYLAHIFVSSQPNAPSGAIPGKAQNDAQARQKIQMVYQRLKNGEDFASLATRYSEDPETSSRGGQMEPTPESKVKSADPASRDAVLKLKAGEFSPIVSIVNPATQKTLAYRIFRLNGKDAAGQRDLSDPAVQQFIRNGLRKQREQFLQAAFDEVLHDRAEVRNYFAEQILKKSGTGQKEK